MHDLDRYLAIKASIYRLVDAGHATVGQLADELITPIDKLAGQVRHKTNSR